MLEHFEADSERRTLGFTKDLDPESDRTLIMRYWFPIVHLVAYRSTGFSCKKLFYVEGDL